MDQRVIAGKSYFRLEVQKDYFIDRTITKNLADRTVQKWQQTWESDNTVAIYSR